VRPSCPSCETIHVDPLLIAVVGPTASGKTALALALAEALNGEVVSCDSVAVYRDFEIGTAKPSAEDRLRVPHHMLDVADPALSNFTAGEYSRLGRFALDEIKQREKTPIVAGGTGLYLRALIEGLFPGPQRSEEMRDRLRAIAEKKGALHLHRILQRMDSASAGTIHANDVPKVIRALEICLAAREPMSEMWKQGRDHLEGFRVLYLALDPDRTLLYERINKRCADMFAAGLIDEARSLAHKYAQIADIPNSPINSPGYRQALAHLRGEMSLKDAITSTQQAHRNYAKRQLTWFRGLKDVHWLRGFGDEASTTQQALQIAQKPEQTA
jgi:tRNA dimethylallyltransferase